MSQRGLSLTLILAVSILGGCQRDNGLPSDLQSHLAQRGINITPTRVHGPLSSRGGYVVTTFAPETVANLVATFKLKRIHSDDRQWRWSIDRTGGVGTVRELWGVTGRPAQFKLRNGAQFEYFYIIITDDGFMYLVAEYAYG